MGLQFGAVLSGMATKIAERVEEEEKRVDLLTNRYLDLHTQRKMEADKANEKNVQMAEELINALGVTGLDLETRAAIAAGGSTSVSHALDQYGKAVEKGLDFGTIYNVKAPTPGTEEFNSTDWAGQIAKRVSVPTIDTSVLGESRTIFGSDPKAVLAAKLDALDFNSIDTAVEQNFRPAQLQIDASGLAEDPDKTKLYTSTEAAVVGTQQLLLAEQNKPEAEQDAETIANLTGSLTAYKALDDAKKTTGQDKGNLISNNIDTIGSQLAEEQAKPESERDAAKITSLDAALKVWTGVSQRIKTDTAKPGSDSVPASHNAILAQIDNDLRFETDPGKIAELKKQRDQVFQQMVADKKALADAEGGKPEDYTIFNDETINGIINNAESRINSPKGFKYGIDGRLETALEGNEGKYYLGVLQAIDEVRAGYVTVKDKVLTNNLDARETTAKNGLTAYMNQKFNRYLTNSQLPTEQQVDIKKFHTAPDSRTADANGKNGQYAIGDVVYINVNNNPLLMVWTGTGFTR